MRVIKRSFLPTTTFSVHASTIEFWEDHPVFAWFGGTREGEADVSIYINNLKNDNKTIVFGNKDYIPRWNPILYNYNGQLFLFEKVGEFCDRWQTFIHNITNWCADVTEKEIRGNMQVLPSGLNGPVKTKPVEYNGVIYCGSSVETFYDWTSYIEAYKIEHGQWELFGHSKPIIVRHKVPYREPMTGRTLLSKGVIQPSLWIEEYDSWSDKTTNMKCLMRSCGLNKAYYHENDLCNPDDEGCLFISTLPEAIPTNLPNPNSSLDTVFHNGFLYLVCNPQSDSRSPLVLHKIDGMKMNDEGVMVFNIVDSLVIQDTVEKTGVTFYSKELSYPYMVIKDGQLHITYTYGRALIEYAIVEL